MTALGWAKYINKERLLLIEQWIEKNAVEDQDTAEKVEGIGMKM